MSRNGKIRIVRKASKPEFALEAPPLTRYADYYNVPYGQEFNETLKARIRSRDRHSCRLCGCKTRILHVHHINYLKADCSDSNLITLCEFCHKKTNKQRDYWYRYLYNLIRGT